MLESVLRYIDMLDRQKPPKKGQRNVRIAMALQNNSIDMYELNVSSLVQQQKDEATPAMAAFSSKPMYSIEIPGTYSQTNRGSRELILTLLCLTQDIETMYEVCQ